MYSLTKEQKISNLEELITQKSKKVENLQKEVEFLKKKLSKLQNSEIVPTSEKAILNVELLQGLEEKLNTTFK